MGSGYGACEDRGCGNVGSVQEVSTHTHRSSKYCTQYRGRLQ